MFGTEARVEIDAKVCDAAKAKLSARRKAVNRLKRQLRDASTQKAKSRLRDKLADAKARRAKTVERVGEVC